MGVTIISKGGPLVDFFKMFVGGLKVGHSPRLSFLSMTKLNTKPNP